MLDIDLIKKTFESQTGLNARHIVQMKNVENNSIYKIYTDTLPYIFKIYKSSTWPETGKLPFVSKQLKKHGIPHARMLAFNREDINFPTGYLIEECLPGTTADKLTYSLNEKKLLFLKLAELVSNIHLITLKNYGYTGSGTASCTSFSEFIHDCMEDCTSKLIENNLIDYKQMECIWQETYLKLKTCDHLPSVLCHGDLSTKNMLVYLNGITLIDWDDVYSLCWVTDVARMTLWMKMEYGDYIADILKKSFLDGYATKYNKNHFYEIENTLHIWYGLDFLNYYVDKPQYEYMKKILMQIFIKNNIDPALFTKPRSEIC